jgi:hypothetical protein
MSNPYREGEKSPSGPYTVLIWEGDVVTEYGKDRIRIIKIFDGKMEQHVMERCKGPDALGAQVWLRVMLIDVR